MKRILSLLCLLAFTACSSFKEKVGLVKEQPDEYQVITNPPLSVPEDLVNVKSPEQLTQTTNIGSQDNKNLSKGENSLLKNMGKN